MKQCLNLCSEFGPCSILVKSTPKVEQAVLFLLHISTTSFLLLTVSDEFHAEKITTIRFVVTHSPNYSRLLFLAFRSLLSRDGTRNILFFLMTIDQSYCPAKSRPLHHHFIFNLLNVRHTQYGPALAVSSITNHYKTLESNASHMKVAFIAKAKW